MLDWRLGALRGAIIPVLSSANSSSSETFFTVSSTAVISCTCFTSPACSTFCSLAVSTLAVDSEDIIGEFGVVVVDEMEKMSIAFDKESKAALLRFSESFMVSVSSSFSP
ncbi:hypothetical protein OGATHE_004332 [Ogataea polymorpha]|uniref:Uncharacterized protein n=1 Tax=Ogataea polymorpha TaxID=460523 RepID=A0A9P8P0N3_9ASCO|nr:hypothetical protein OGATHE_004332 [Ogataea polymorpha]